MLTRAIARFCAFIAAAATAVCGACSAPRPMLEEPDPQSVAAFGRLVTLAGDAMAVAQRLNAQARRADGRTLFVELSANPGGSPSNWPADYAPREEFVKLADAALWELVGKGVPARLAQLILAPSISYPPEHPADPPALLPAAFRFVLDVQERVVIYAARAGNDAAAADGLVVYLKIARSAADAEGILSPVACGEVRRGVEIAMSLVADGKLGPQARRRLAAGFPRPFPAPEDELAFRHARVERDIKAVWSTLPPALFGNDPDAGDLAWDSLDARTRVFLGVLGAGLEEAAEDRLPTASEVLGEASMAAVVLRSWIGLPPAVVQTRAREMAAEAADRAGRHTAALISIWAANLRESAEATLALDSLRIVLALESWRDAHGAYPASLENLVPGETPRIPPDPARPSKTLLYIPGERTIGGHAFRYTLYSRGADGEDNGGAPSDRPPFSLGAHVRAGEDVILNAFHVE